MSKVNPLALASIGVFAVLGSLFIREFWVGVLSLSIYLIVGTLFVRPKKYLVITFGFALLPALAVAYSTWRLGTGGVDQAVVAAIRIIVLAWPGSVVALFIDPMRLGDYLAQSLKMPSAFVVATTSAGTQAGNLSRSFGIIRSSRRIRGLQARGIQRIPQAFSVLFSLFVSGMRQATDQAIVLQARGFVPGAERTWAGPATWTRLDVVVVLVAGALAVLPALALVAGP